MVGGHGPRASCFALALLLMLIIALATPALSSELQGIKTWHHQIGRSLFSLPVWLPTSNSDVLLPLDEVPPDVLDQLDLADIESSVDVGRHCTAIPAMCFSCSQCSDLEVEGARGGGCPASNVTSSFARFSSACKVAESKGTSDPHVQHMYCTVQIPRQQKTINATSEELGSEEGSNTGSEHQKGETSGSSDSESLRHISAETESTSDDFEAEAKVDSWGEEETLPGEERSGEAEEEDEWTRRRASGKSYGFSFDAYSPCHATYPASPVEQEGDLSHPSAGQGGDMSHFVLFEVFMVIIAAVAAVVMQSRKKYLAATVRSRIGQA